MTHLRSTTITFSLAVLLAAGAACNTAVTPAAPEGTAAGGSPVACDSLASLLLPNVTITAAEAVAAGAFTPPMPPGPWAK